MDVSEHRWKAESKAGDCKQEVRREGGGRAVPKPQKGVRSPEGRGSRVGEEAERSGKGWRRRDREGGVDGEGGAACPLFKKKNKLTAR